MSIPTNNLPTAEVVTDDDTIVGNDGGSTVGVTKQFAGTAFLRPEQIGEDVASQADVDGKVSKTGDTMTGTLRLNTPNLDLDSPTENRIRFLDGGSLRWQLVSIPGSDAMQLRRYDDSGNHLDTPIWVDENGQLRLTGASSVIVPPATLPNSAARKQDVDAKVSKSGDEMSGTLTISNWTRVSGNYPSVYLFDQDGTPDQRTFQMGSNGSVTVLRAIRDDNTVSNAFMQMYHDTGRLNLGVSTEVLVPANSGTGAVNQAARITQRDPATGRLQIDGHEMGDTGWIDIASWTEGVQDGVGQLGVINTDNFTLVGTAKLQIRRSREIVYFRMTGGTATDRMLSTSTGQKGLFTTAVWPTGFRMNEFGSVFPLTTREQFVPMYVARATPADFRIVTPSGPAPLMTPFACWPTEDGWPSAFPWLA